jgi:hypothetical protein
MILKTVKCIIKHFEDTSYKRDKRFLPVELWIVSEGENPNKSNFLAESLDSAVQKFRNISLSAKYEKAKKDFLGHEVLFKGVDEDGWGKYEYIETPIGLIPESGNPRISISEEDGKRWIVADAIIWSERNRDIESLLLKNKINNISMEIVVDDYYDENGVQVIKDFTPLSVTFLGQDRKTGIRGAKSIVKEDFDNFSQSLMLAFESEPEYGYGDRIKIDLKKTSVSDTDWGDVDKTELRNQILAAENYEQLVEKCYMLIEDGWQDAPSEKLGYPVCQIISGKLVYNRKAVSSVRGFLERNKDEPYYPAVNARLIKVEKKIGVWKEFDNIKFEGGADLLNEKIMAFFSEQFGDNLISVNDNFVSYAKIEDGVMKFFAKKYAVEPCEDAEDEETLLMEEDEKELDIRFALSEVTEDGSETVSYMESDGFNKVVSKVFEEKTAKENELNEKNIQFEEVKAELDTTKAELEKEKAEKEEFACKNEKYEKEKLNAELSKVVKTYEEKLGKEGTAEWTEKIVHYEDTEKLEKDILYHIVKNGSFEDVSYKIPVGKKQETKAKNGCWDIIEKV